MSIRDEVARQGAVWQVRQSRDEHFLQEIIKAANERLALLSRVQPGSAQFRAGDQVQFRMRSGAIVAGTLHRFSGRNAKVVAQNGSVYEVGREDLRPVHRRSA